MPGRPTSTSSSRSAPTRTTSSTPRSRSRRGPTAPSTGSDDDLVDLAAAAADAAVGRRDGEAPLANPRYTFATFVTGTSNRFAQAAALAVAETPAKSYNPLFIYGSAGLGKTHLLQAISHYVNEHYPSFTVRYVSTEHFLNQYVDAIRTGEMPGFKRRYREVDVLLLDDIQFVEGKEGLQEELFHTFNTLHQANRQIVLSSDRPPDAISTLEDRLRSRFRMGLITEINPPELRDPPRHPPQEVRGRAGAGPRRRPRVHRHGHHQQHPRARGRPHPGVGLRQPHRRDPHARAGRAGARRPAQRLASPRSITPQRILQKTSEMFGFSIEEIQGKSRRRPLVTARQISHVRVPRAHRPQLPGDRPRVRRPRPHHGHPRGREDQRPDEGAAPDLRPGDRAHQSRPVGELSGR